MFIMILFKIVEILRQHKCPSNRQMGKDNLVCIAMECNSLNQKKTALPFDWMWVNLKDFMLSKIT